MFSKADFALLFLFVVYRKNINNGMVLACVRFNPEGGSRVRRARSLGPASTGSAATLRKQPQSQMGLGSFH